MIAIVEAPDGCLEVPIELKIRFWDRKGEALPGFDKYVSAEFESGFC